MKNIPYMELDATSTYVKGVGYTDKLKGTAVVVPVGKKPEDMHNMYWVDGKWVERPVSPVPVSLGDAWRLAECPVGTLIEVIGLIENEVLLIHEVTESAPVDFTLPDAGLYQIRVTAPLPYTISKTHIEVPDA